MKSNCPYWWGKGHRWQNPHWFLPDLCLELVVLGRTAEGRSEQELLAHCYSLWARPLASLSVRSYPRCLCQKGALCLCSQAGLRAHSLTQLIWYQVRLCVVSCLAYPLESRESTQPCSLGQRAGVCCRACQLLRSTRQVDLPLAVLLSQLSIHKALSNLYFIILRKKFTCYFSQYSYFFSELCEIIGHNLVFGSYLKFTGVILEFS